MPIKSQMAGLSGAARQGAGGAVQSGVTAAGSTQSDATAVVDAVNTVTTVPVGSGVILRGDTEPGDCQVVANFGANSLSVYPPTSGILGTNAANIPVVLLPGQAAAFYVASNAASGFTFVVV